MTLKIEDGCSLMTNIKMNPKVDEYLSKAKSGRKNMRS